jgi:hypothetical protein
MERIVSVRFPPAQWNIYAAQASDGDNMASDNAVSVEFLRSAILPLAQYYAYLQVGRGDEDRPFRSNHESGLWRAYEGLLGGDVPMAMRKVGEPRDIYPVFRELFARRTDKRVSA